MPDTLDALRARFPAWKFALLPSGRYSAEQENGSELRFLSARTAKELREKLEDEGE